MPRKKLGLSPGKVAEPKEIVVPGVLSARGRVYDRRGRLLGQARPHTHRRSGPENGRYEMCKNVAF